MLKKKSLWERFPKLKEIEAENKFPNHVFIIPDGNGRWAKRVRNAFPTVGHRVAVKIIKELLKDIRQLPIKYITIWGFACDNWKRSKREVDGLMKLYEKSIYDVLPELIENNNRFLHIGRKDRIPKSLKIAIEKAEKETKKNTGQTFTFAIDYGGEDQELRAMERLIKMGLPKNTKMTKELRSKALGIIGRLPTFDLIIRTSGEQRINDLGQISRSAEFYFEKKFFPEIKINDFINALIDYAKRERRFGGRLKQ